MKLEDLKSSKKPIIGNIEKYGNWIIGANGNNFIDTDDFDVGIFKIEKGYEGDSHIHKISSEFNLIIKGKCTVLIDGIKHKLSDGDFFFYPPGCKSCLKCTDNTILLCIKIPAATIPDKFYDEPKEDDDG